MNKTYYNLYNRAHDSGHCPTDVPSDEVWSYTSDPQSSHRGRYACYDNVSGFAELNFTSNDLLVFGSLVGGKSDTVRDVRNAWNADDWVFESINP